MRTIIDLPEDQVKALSEICSRQKVSRAQAIRQALKVYIAQVEVGSDSQAFGLWKKKGVNSLKFEDALRSEWEK